MVNIIILTVCLWLMVSSVSDYNWKWSDLMSVKKLKDVIMLQKSSPQLLNVNLKIDYLYTRSTLNSKLKSDLMWLAKARGARTESKNTKKQLIDSIISSYD